MSALAGFWSIYSQVDEKSACEAMLEAQRLYGLDSQQSCSFGPMSFGRNLCAVLPEDDWDHQPLIGGDGRFGLVADVRLDNRRELSSELGLNRAEATQLADSDYLLKALEKWGDGALSRILGDFAFAWFDRFEHRLLLARDPLGQRPLFWHRGRDFVAFASMPKGLHVLNGVTRQPNPEAVCRFVDDGRPLISAESFFAGIERVPPGHIVTITPDGERFSRYWEPKRRTLRLSRFEDYVDAYRDELDRSVRARLRTRAPVIATHLSGGWDSGAVTATAARLSQHRLMAFTATPSRATALLEPRNRFSNEWPLAASVAALYPHLEHHSIEHDLSSPLESLDQSVFLFERPIFNLCNHGWLAQIRASARDRGAQVLLSGDIGNWSISASPMDVLSHYRSEHGWGAWWEAASGLTARGEARWRGVFAGTFSNSLPRVLWRALAPLSSTARELSALRPELRRRLAPSGEQLAEDCFARTVNAYYHMDFGEYRKGILGGWGIDKRDPTSDVRLLEFCLSLPTEMLLNSDERRPLARASLSDRLPAAVLNARGKGYQSPEWHVGLTRDLPRVEALIEEIAANRLADSIMDVDLLRRMVDNWPRSEWESRRTIALYRNTFLQALTAGHFLLHASGAIKN